MVYCSIVRLFKEYGKMACMFENLDVYRKAVDFIDQITIVRGSMQECIPLLELARRKGFIDDVAIHDLRDQLEVIAKKLSGLINGLDMRKT